MSHPLSLPFTFFSLYRWLMNMSLRGMISNFSRCVQMTTRSRVDPTSSESVSSTMDLSHCLFGITWNRVSPVQNSFRLLVLSTLFPTNLHESSIVLLFDWIFWIVLLSSLILYKLQGRYSTSLGMNNLLLASLCTRTNVDSSSHFHRSAFFLLPSYFLSLRDFLFLLDPIGSSSKTIRFLDGSWFSVG